ncbi:MAG: CDP-alcohol phosphatidyltransferase family protein [Gammaproteobacteria bacterium]|nr:CDP-alcohol phosphatidyltransferase family protein [Gammaproteobacteria bacterium]
MIRRTIPNTLSILRGASGFVFFAAITLDQWVLAFGVFVYAAISDLLDGPLARRFKQANSLGTRIDHTADCIFVFLGLLALSLHLKGAVPIVLPVVQLVAFVEYAAFKSIRQSSMLPSKLGRYNGIAYFVVIGATTTQMALQINWIPFLWIYVLSWGLVVATLLSLCMRIKDRLTDDRH